MSDLPDEPTPPSGALIRPFLDSAPEGGAPDPDEPADSAAVEVPAAGPSLRPFLLTDGRVAHDDSIALETQVVTTDLGRTGTAELGFERRDIVALCSDPQSVAEIAAQLSLHLGVVRVLVGDLSAEGHVSVHAPTADVATDVDTLMRVIRGLGAIG